MTSSPQLAGRIANLARALSYQLYERDHAVRLCLLAALCGESVFLLGPPGIGKSLLARRMKQVFHHARAFEYLMTRFSTPEELFGPLSIEALKQGRYQRLCQGYLPEAEIVFLDEIWKSGPAILNTLLTVVNERRFRNGHEEKAVPLRLLVTASNELPEADSGLEALYDRMLIRLSLENIRQKDSFYALLNGRDESAMSGLSAQLTISDEEYQLWQQQISQVSLPAGVFDLLFALRQQLISRNMPVISDRRWKKALRLLQASAFFSGRNAVSPVDLALLSHCLWHTPDDIAVLQAQISDLLCGQGWQQQQLRRELDDVCQQEYQRRQQQAGRQALTVLVKRRCWGKRFVLPDGLSAGELHLPLEQPLSLHDRLTAVVSLDAAALNRWLAQGGDIRGKLDGVGFPLALDLLVDQQQLWIRDSGLQRSRLLLPGSQLARFSDAACQQLEALAQRWQRLYQQFREQQGCLFIDDDWLARIENSLQEVLTQINQARAHAAGTA